MGTRSLANCSEDERIKKGTDVKPALADTLLSITFLVPAHLSSESHSPLVFLPNHSLFFHLLNSILFFFSLQFLKSLTQPMPVPLHQQSWQVSRRGLKTVGFDNPDTAFMKIQTPPFPPLTAWVCHYSMGTMTMHLKACWTLVLNPRALYSLEKLSHRKSISKTGWFTYCRQVFAGTSFKSALMLPSGLIVSTSMSFPCLQTPS